MEQHLLCCQPHTAVGQPGCVHHAQVQLSVGPHCCNFLVLMACNISCGQLVTGWQLHELSHCQYKLKTELEEALPDSSQQPLCRRQGLPA